jgi:hypothetical protein
MSRARFRFFLRQLLKPMPTKSNALHHRSRAEVPVLNAPRFITPRRGLSLRWCQPELRCVPKFHMFASCYYFIIVVEQ